MGYYPTVWNWWLADVDGSLAPTTRLAVLRTASLATFLSVLSGCSDTCANTPISRTDAPDGRHTAVMFQRDCGATTGFSTQVSILKNGVEEFGSGNAFRADDDHGAAAAGEWGGPWAEVTWTAQDNLVIRYAAKSRLSTQKDEVLGVKISYKQVTR